MGNTTEPLDELRAKHGELLTFSKRGQTYALCRPSEAAFLRFTDKIASDKGGKAVVMKELVLSCAVHPSRDALRELLSEYPALTLTLAAKLQELAGADIEVDVEKKD